MLTPEQIKNLKPGDPVIIEATFYKLDYDGDVIGETTWTTRGVSEKCKIIAATSCVSLPSEIVNRQSSIVNKYDPTRLFKKGDKVQPRGGKTVLASEYGFVTFHELAGQYEVYEDEARGTVTLIVNGHACFVSAFALELITPVEDLEPYIMLENVPSNSIEVRDKRTNKVEATFYFGKDHAYTFEQAATRAEAERDRLNEEWRKEQK